MSRQLNKQTRKEMYKDLLQEILRTQDLEYLVHGIHLNTCITIREDTFTPILLIEVIGIDEIVFYSTTIERKDNKPITISTLKRMVKSLPDLEKRLQTQLQREWNELKEKKC